MTEGLAERMAEGLAERMAERFSRKRILIFTVTALLFSQTTASFSAEDQSGSSSPVQESSYERVIAHGGGSYKGYETTNSVEAVNNAIANGFHIIELDMDLSTDNKIIMLHDWERTASHYYGSAFPKKLSLSQFTHLSVYGRLEVLTMEKLAKILEANRDIRIITDTKGDNIELLTAISEQYPKLLDRFIPQIYDYGQWDQVKELGFSDIIFTMYAMAAPDLRKLSAFVKDHEIYAAAMPDYMAKRGYLRTLANDGIKVYIHPVSSYDEAQQYLKQGAWGIYSGVLLPEEFVGIEKDYYLAVDNKSGVSAKLTDDRITGLKELALHGRQPIDTVIYCLDDSDRRATDADFNELTAGKHKLTVRIVDGKVLKGELDYFLLKDENGCRVVHKKYEYRLDAVKKEKDLDAALRDANISEDIRRILENSLIAKQGESSYYTNGSPDRFQSANELLTVQKGSYGRILLPLSDTLKKLGASSVSMSKSRDIAITYNGENYRIMANSSIIRKGFIPKWLKYPVSLYLNKAMAGGEFYQYMTGRESVEKDGLIIILPDGTRPSGNQEEQLFFAAGKLF